VHFLHILGSHHSPRFSSGSWISPWSTVSLLVLEFNDPASFCSGSWIPLPTVPFLTGSQISQPTDLRFLNLTTQCCFSSYSCISQRSPISLPVLGSQNSMHPAVLEFNNPRSFSFGSCYWVPPSKSQNPSASRSYIRQPAVTSHFSPNSWISNPYIFWFSNSTTRRYSLSSRIPLPGRISFLVGESQN
jgi:hypothetical protein